MEFKKGEIVEWIVEDKAQLVLRRLTPPRSAMESKRLSDWSAAYRLFAHERFDPQELLAPARRAVLEQLSPEQPLAALLDDALLRKRGREPSRST